MAPAGHRKILARIFKGATSRPPSGFWTPPSCRRSTQRPGLQGPRGLIPPDPPTPAPARQGRWGHAPLGDLAGAWGPSVPLFLASGPGWQPTLPLPQTQGKTLFAARIQTSLSCFLPGPIPGPPSLGQAPSAPGATFSSRSYDSGHHSQATGLPSQPGNGGHMGSCTAAPHTVDPRAGDRRFGNK